MPYTILPHTADWMVEATGKTLEEAFCEAAKGAFEVVIDPKLVDEKISYSIDVTAKRKMTLLYEFIEQLIILQDTKGFILHEVKQMRMTQQGEEFHLTCTVVGDHHKNYDTHSAIKSMTYSDMLIKEEKGKVTVRLTVDI